MSTFRGESTSPRSVYSGRYMDLSDTTIQNNVDDGLYRYSSEWDRGTPRTGAYAYDGIWEEEEDTIISNDTTLRPSSTSTTATGIATRKSHSVKQALTGGSISKGRGRSGTIGSMNGSNSVKQELEKTGGIWSWGRKSNPTTPNLPEADVMPPTITPPIPAEVVKTKSIKKERSRSMLRGKGRRGELSLEAANAADESFEAPPPPLPPTPASFATSSPYSMTESYLSPRTFPSRVLAELENPNIPTAPAQTEVTGKSAKSSWKRGMQKIFKSKSSAALREAFSSTDPNRPPVPLRPDGLPRGNQHPLGQPFSSSTPPLGSQQSSGDVWGLYKSPIPAPTPREYNYASFESSPALPPDPFASPFSPSQDAPAHSRGPSMSRAGSSLGLRGHSPSLRDLTHMLNPKGALTKAKSMANIREKASEPTSAPPQKTAFSTQPLPAAKFPKRVRSAVGLTAKISEPSLEAIKEMPTTLPLQRPTLLRMPTESPPLLLPQPPFFGTSSSLAPISSGESSPTSPTGTMDLSKGLPMTPPPSTPLPAPPATTPITGNSSSPPVKRSASGAVLLPRSRSTSMSLKAPPTSSSFFDLYEQLGIWPTNGDNSTSNSLSVDANPPSPAKVSKVEEEKEQEKEPEPTKEDKENVSPPIDYVTLSESPSIAFSSASWQAAISAFPLVEDPSLSGTSSVHQEPPLDFGQPEVGDTEELGGIMSDSPAELGDDAVMDNIPTACEMSKDSSSTGKTGGQGTSQQTSNANTARPSGASRFSHGLNKLNGRSSQGLGQGGAGDSEDSSPSGSRDEEPLSLIVARSKSKHGHSSSSSEDEDEGEADDMPLSQLHPQAAADQQTKIEKSRSVRSSRSVVPRGRNPGAGTGWNGEGGVPADLLSAKLEAFVIRGKSRLYSWQNGAEPSSSRQRTLDMPPPAAPVPTSAPIRKSATEPIEEESKAPARPIRRPDGPPRMDTFGSSTEQRPAMFSSLQPSPVIRQTDSMSHNSPHSDGRRNSGANVSRSSTINRPQERDLPAAGVSRNSTTRSTSSATLGRSRAISNAPSLSQVSENSHTRLTMEPSKAIRKAMKVPAVIGHLGGTKIVLDVYQDTTARDILMTAYRNGQLAEPTSQLGWVVIEMFGELGCERHVREYEPMQSIIAGWDPTSPANFFMLAQSNRAITTFARAIPATAPFVGGYVQYESKKSKWSKRYLETRGGQVFLAKNEKNKEEIQLNTLFHDVYTSAKPRGAPKPFTFIIKRNNAASTFENPQEYMHCFSAEEAIGWKLVSAIYEAKSLAMSQAMPHVLGRISNNTAQRKNTAPDAQGPGPLIDLVKEKKEERSAFTGKGLLKI